jgi:hypothetical protein
MTRALRAVPAVLTPVLVATFPLLSLFANNQSELELSVLWRPLAWCLVGTLAGFVALVAVSRRLDRAGVWASLAALAFFYYGLFFSRGSTVTLALWLLGFAVAGWLVGRVRNLGPAVLVVLAAAAVMTVPRVVTIAKYQHDHPSLAASDSRLWPTSLPAPAKAAALPDIYLLMPDDYARADVLKTYFQYDDSAFLSQLASRGFTVAANARSPYSDSESNMASTLNLDYLTSFPKVLGKDSQDVRPVKRVMADNRAARLLRQAGYDYLHLDTDEVTFAGGNPRISSLAPPDGFPNLWLRQTVLHRVGGPFGFNDSATNSRYRRSVDKIFGELDALRSSARPRFVVFHTLLPHDPYVFTADGKRRDYAGPSDASLASAAGRAAYVQQLEHLNTRLLTAIDQIRAHATRPTAIVLQSDEGFSADPAVVGEEAVKQIRVKGLLAVLLPGTSSAGLPNPPNTVNTLRVVLNRYLGTSYPILPSASHAEGDLPYQSPAIDVR